MAEALTVSIPIEVLEAEVLRLPQVERARLLDRVVASLDADKARDEAWERLAAERDAELESGASSPVSGRRPLRGCGPSCCDLYAAPRRGARSR